MLATSLHSMAEHQRKYAIEMVTLVMRCYASWRVSFHRNTDCDNLDYDKLYVFHNVMCRTSTRR